MATIRLVRDNTSVTVVETSDEGMILVRGGREADTLIR